MSRGRWMRPAVIMSMVALLLPLGLAQSEPKDAVEYKIFIACPDNDDGLCPVEAWDGQDALGSPAIAVDPDNVDNMIIASLHSRPAANGPEERSRAGTLQFTTHTSTDHGSDWLDNPYSQPDEIPPDATGEHPGITLDPYGHVFISSMYAVPEQIGNETAWGYVIAAQKFGDLEDINQNQDGQYNVDYVPSLFPYNRIGQTWFVYDTLTDHAVLLWNEQVTPFSTARNDGNTTQIPGALGKLGTLSGALQPSAQDTPMSAIGWVWTGSEVGDPYRAVDGTYIAPCSTSTNPVVSEGWLYVGCKVAKGQPAPEWDPTAKAGEVHMFRFRPAGGEPEHLGRTPISGGEPKLGVRSDGRMALMTTEVVETEQGPRIRLDGVYGQYSDKRNAVVWGDVRHYGEDLAVLYANMQLVETNIQDMIYREYSGVIHLIFKRVVEWPPDPPWGYRPEYFKAIVAIDEHYGVLDEIDLGIGDMRKRQKDSLLYNNPVSVYNDLSDDFLELPPAPFWYDNRPLGETYQREFYAVGNYGFVDFAELIEVTELRGPAAPGLPNPPPPPTPAPATASSLALGMAGALTASALTVGTAASAKRKSHVGAGRKRR